VIIVCIDSDKLPSPNLTLNKLYEVLYETSHWYEITNDAGFSALYDKWRFLTIYELRHQRIIEILY
jgi:hypothetical protein